MRSFSSYISLRYRHIGNYRLDGEDATIRASGHDVLDLAITKPLRPWLDLNFDIDNLTDKVYYETQNYSSREPIGRLRPSNVFMARRVTGSALPSV